MPINPQNYGLDLGTAAQTFLQSFFAARQRKDNDKYRKLDPIINSSLEIIRNKHTPLDAKANAFDALGHLLNPKEVIPLSKHLGLRDLAEDQFQTEAASIETEQDTQGTVAGKRGKDIPAKYRRRGEMSDADYEQIFTRETQDYENKLTTERAVKLKKLDAEQREQELKDIGWEKRGSVELNTKTNQYQQTWVNPRTGDTKTIKYDEGIIPAEVLQTQIKANATKNRPSVMLKEKTAFYLTQPNPKTGQNYTEEEAEEQALIDINNYRKAQEEYLRLGKKEREQTTEGTRPSSESQREAKELERLRIGIDLQNRSDIAEERYTTANTAAEATQTAWENHIAANQNFYVKSKSGDRYVPKDKEQYLAEIAEKNSYDPEDKGYKMEAERYDRAIAEYRKLETAHNRAYAVAQGAKTKWDNAVNQLNKFNGNSDSENSNQTLKLNPQQQNLVDKFKSNPKNQSAIQGMSDTQIWQILQQAYKEGKLK